jgi:antitoxin VapB
MSLNIKNRETVALATEVARRAGQTKTAAIHQALEERLRRMGGDRAERDSLLAELRAIRTRVARLPVGEDRSAEDIIGYNDHGVPT